MTPLDFPPRYRTVRPTRPLSEAELAYLRDVMEPVRNKVELAKLRRELNRNPDGLLGTVNAIDLAIAALVVAFIALCVVVGSL